MVKFDRIVFRIEVCQEFFELSFLACVYKEDVVYVPGVKETIIVNPWVDVGFFKLSHVNGGI